MAVLEITHNGSWQAPHKIVVLLGDVNVTFVNSSRLACRIQFDNFPTFNLRYLDLVGGETCQRPIVNREDTTYDVFDKSEKENLHKPFNGPHSIEVNNTFVATQVVEYEETLAGE